MTEVSGTVGQSRERGKRRSMQEALHVGNLGSYLLTRNFRVNGKCAASGGVT